MCQYIYALCGFFPGETARYKINKVIRKIITLVFLFFCFLVGFFVVIVVVFLFVFFVWVLSDLFVCLLRVCCAGFPENLKITCGYRFF